MASAPFKRVLSANRDEIAAVQSYTAIAGPAMSQLEIDMGGKGQNGRDNEGRSRSI